MKPAPAARRNTALELTPDEFRAIGHRLVDRLAGFLADLPTRRVSPGETAAQIRAALDTSASIPDSPADSHDFVDHITTKLIEHSLFNGHPRFFGYVTSSAAPIGAFGDLIAATLNPNIGSWTLGPAGTEMELQTLRWIAELIGYPTDTGGLLVSGGNMANLVGFLTARAARFGLELRKGGLRALAQQPRCYSSTETHTWIQKAADLSGLGTDAIRWIPADARQRLDLARLRDQVAQDIAAGDAPFLVVGNAGSVSTGAVDPLPAIAAFCREHNLWFHVDGAYGGVAAKVSGAPPEVAALAQADSVAIDPHKWLYAPLEAGCILVRDTRHLLDTFSYRPPYYRFDTDVTNFFDLGPQNSRGFRALKVWLAFRQAGREGYLDAIAEDIRLAEHAFQLFDRHPDFEAITRNLSICTFRYVPAELRAAPGAEALVNEINQEILSRLEETGEAFLSNAVVDGRYLLRLCIVNFRTTDSDVESLPGILARLGREAYAGRRGTQPPAGRLQS